MSTSGQEEEVRYLFVYGTLRPSYMRLPTPVRRMRPPHVLDKHGKWVCEGTLDGYAVWDIGRYPGIVPTPDEIVRGDVFDVSSALHMLELLDEYEGIGGIFERPFEYKREVVEIDVQDDTGHRKVRAWVYVYNWAVEDSIMRLVPDGDYVMYCANRL